MSSKGGGTVGRFISQPDFPWRDEFQNLIPGSKDFTAKWKEIAKLHPAEFQEAQHAYIKRTYFDLLIAKIEQGDKGDKIDTRADRMRSKTSYGPPPCNTIRIRLWCTVH
jgi:hypothetical protein